MLTKHRRESQNMHSLTCDGVMLLSNQLEHLACMLSMLWLHNSYSLKCMIMSCLHFEQARTHN